MCSLAFPSSCGHLSSSASLLALTTASFLVSMAQGLVAAELCMMPCEKSGREPGESRWKATHAEPADSTRIRSNIIHSVLLFLCRTIARIILKRPPFSPSLSVRHPFLLLSLFVLLPSCAVIPTSSSFILSHLPGEGGGINHAKEERGGRDPFSRA